MLLVQKRMEAMKTIATKKNPTVVVIGGGTGNFTLLGQLKLYTQNITAIVSMADDGGSTGILRDELGVLPPGDVRQCLVALSPESSKVRQLFNYRFGEGTMEGHAFGNLFLTALEKMTGSFAEAVETASEVLRITGKVTPITLDNVRLVLDVAPGFKVRGEGNIDILHFNKQGTHPTLSLEPVAHINPEAREAILAADLVVIAPGDLYTSVGPALIVDGVTEALARTSATIAYVCNLVTKPGQTDGFTVADYASEIERFAGGPILDYVLYNTAEPNATLFQKYTKQRELPVETGNLDNVHYKLIGRPFVSNAITAVAANDPLAVHRSFIRHDADAVAQCLFGLLS